MYLFSGIIPSLITVAVCASGSWAIFQFGIPEYIKNSISKKLSLGSKKTTYFLASKTFETDYNFSDLIPGETVEYDTKEYQKYTITHDSHKELIESLKTQEWATQQLSDDLSQSKKSLYIGSSKEYKCAVPNKSSSSTSFSFDFDCQIFSIDKKVKKTSEVLSNKTLLTNKNNIDYQKFYVVSMNTDNVKNFRLNTVIDIIERSSQSVSVDSRILKMTLNYRFFENNKYLDGKTKTTLVTVKDPASALKSKTTSEPWGCGHVDKVDSFYKCLVFELNDTSGDPDFNKPKLIDQTTTLKKSKIYAIWFLKDGFYLQQSTKLKQPVYFSFESVPVLRSKRSSSMSPTFEYHSTIIGFFKLKQLNSSNILIMDSAKPRA